MQEPSFETDKADSSFLVDGKYSIKDLVDMEQLRDIFEAFHKATGCTIGFLSYPQQEVLITVGWRDLCVKFHRATKKGIQCCLDSNNAMIGKLRSNGDINVEPCAHGLVDGGTPILIKGKHVATLASGQVFFKQPDMEWYRKRAEEFGYDEKSYLEAVRQIPVTDETTFRGVISFLSKIALFVSELGYKGLELETRNAEMERIMYTVSHDLKTPLITIKGFLGLIRKNTQCPGDPKCANYCERIGKATDNMRDLLEQLLSLSRVGRIMSPIIEIPFTGLATEAVGLLSPKITAKGAHVDIQNDMPHVHGEYHRLLETLQNLLENSLKFMGDQKDPRIQIGYRSGHHGNVFYVKDNGIGIEPKYHKKVFNLFDKLDTKTEGTGAGLAIVKRTIEVHGGNVWVESDGKNGTAICFTLGKKADTTEKKDG